MEKEEVKKLCLEKEQELIKKYFGNLAKEAAFERPETIGAYTPDLPRFIEAEFRAFLEKLWKEAAPDEMKGTPLVLEEQKLRVLMTDSDRELLEVAYKLAKRRTLWERITRTNHLDVTHYKGLLKIYTRDLLMIMRCDFLEEITGEYIENKAYKDD